MYGQWTGTFTHVRKTVHVSHANWSFAHTGSRGVFSRRKHHYEFTVYSFKHTLAHPAHTCKTRDTHKKSMHTNINTHPAKWYYDRAFRWLRLSFVEYTGGRKDSVYKRLFHECKWKLSGASFALFLVAPANGVDSSPVNEIWCNVSDSSYVRIAQQILRRVQQ
jgi:hypothetical protein